MKIFKYITLTLLTISMADTYKQPSYNLIEKDSNIGGEQIHAQGQRGLGHDHTYNQNSGVGTGVQTTEVKDDNEDKADLLLALKALAHQKLQNATSFQIPRLTQTN